ncbi:hypothetical protein DFH09DRAFT_1091430 [Mycena vulgaris]|nr:hypothetical protein DFH09DRAFT_1091430 [Mycena vulgaris]
MSFTPLLHLNAQRNSGWQAEGGEEHRSKVNEFYREQLESGYRDKSEVKKIEGIHKPGNLIHLKAADASPIEPRGTNRSAANLVKRRFGPEFDVFEVTERVWSRYNKSHAHSIPAAKDTENIFLEPLQLAAARQNIAAARWLCCRRRAVLFTTGEGARLLKFKHRFLIKLIIPTLVLTGAVNKLLTPSRTHEAVEILLGELFDFGGAEEITFCSVPVFSDGGVPKPIIAVAKLPLTACATAAAQLKYCRRHVTLPLCHAKIAADDFEIAADDEHECR